MATQQQSNNNALYTFAVTTHTAAGGAVNISFVGLGHQCYFNNANEHWKMFNCIQKFSRRHRPNPKYAGHILWVLKRMALNFVYFRSA